MSFKTAALVVDSRQQYIGNTKRTCSLPLVTDDDIAVIAGAALSYHLCNWFDQTITHSIDCFIETLH